MAIIQGIPGLEVTIVTGGRTAKEYNDPSGTGGEPQHPRTVTKYIECKDNEHFKICLKATNEYSWGFKDHALKFEALIDGIWVRDVSCQQVYTAEEDWEQVISYRAAWDPNDHAPFFFQEFAFSTIIKTDDTTHQRVESDVEKMKRLGTIEVKVYRVAAQGNRSISVPSGNHPEDFVVSREAMKGKAQSHGTKFTNMKSTARLSYLNCSTLAEDDGSIAIFRFQYRSREALKLEGVTFDPQQSSNCLATILNEEKKGDEKGISSSKKPERSIAPKLQLYYPLKRNRIWSPYNPMLKRSGSGIGTPPSTISSIDGQARLGAVPPYNISRPVISSTYPQSEDYKLQVKEEAHNSHKTASASKRVLSKPSPQDKAKDNGISVTSAWGTRVPFGFRSCDIARPSVEHAAPGAIRHKFTSKEKTGSKSDKTATHHAGEPSVPSNGTPDSTVNETRGLRPGLGAPNLTTQSPKTPPKTKDEHQEPISSRKEEPESKLRGPRTIFDPNHFRNLADLINRSAPSPSSFPPQARAVSATTPLKSMLPPPPPSPPTDSSALASDQAKPAFSPSSFSSALGVAPASDTTKRRHRDILGISPSPSTDDTRPSKKPKTSEEREIIELSD